LDHSRDHAFFALLAAAQGFFFEIYLSGRSGSRVSAGGMGVWQACPVFIQYVKLPAFADLAGFLTIFVSVVLLAGAIARICPLDGT